MKFMIILLVFFALPASAGLSETNIGPSFKGFIKARGHELVEADGTPLFLRGASLTHSFWKSDYFPDKTYDNESTYSDMAKLGFNSVRFILSYYWLIDIFNPGKLNENACLWIEENARIAMRHGIRLILDMHVPPGGYQSVGKGRDLWDYRENRLELIRIWKMIAGRFSGNTGIIGYDLLNEPWPTVSIRQWGDLSKEIVKAIRETDTNHLIIVERPSAVGDDVLNDDINGLLNFTLIDDPDIMYDFHFYKPIMFTHQSAAWLTFFGSSPFYPDERINEPAGNFIIKGSSFSGSPGHLANPGTDFESPVITITNPDIKFGILLARVENPGLFGSVKFGNVRIEESGPGQTDSIYPVKVFTGDVWLYYDRKDFKPVDWNVIMRSFAISGQEMNFSKSSEGGCFAGIFHLFNLKQGYSYKIKCGISGAGLFGNPAADLGIVLCKSDGEARPFDRSYLEREMDRCSEFSRKANVPVHMGEFGCIYYAFEGHGGNRWIEDVIESCEKRGINYNIWCYADSTFGIYYGDKQDKVNTELYDWLVSRRGQ